MSFIRTRLGWLAGLPALALIGVASAYLAVPSIEDEIARAAAEVARRTGEGQPEPWLRVRVEGRDLVAAGEAPQSPDREAALGRLAGIEGTRRLIDRTGLIEEASPFVWTVERPAADRLEAAGSRPAEIGAFELVQRLKPVLPRTATLDDRTRAARGAPPDFPDAAAYAVERLADLTTGSVATVHDTVISIRGEAASLAAYDALRTALARPPQGFSLGTVEILPPVVADLRLTVERRPDGSLELGGHVASPEAREAIRAAAAESAEGAAIDDRMQDARSLGLDGPAVARTLLKVAALLHEGRVAYEQGRISVAGIALDAGAVGEIEALLRDDLPSGLAAGSVALTARPIVPYVLRVRRGADSVTLSGHLPDEAARESLLARLRPRLFREAVRDRTRLAAGAPDGFTIAVAAGLDALTTLSGGEIAVRGTSVRLSGTSLYPEAAARLSRTLPAAMPAGWSAAVAVSGGETAARLDPQECGRRLAERIVGHPLRFAPGSAALAAEFYPVLDAVAALARDCPTERIEIVGHLDPPNAKPAEADPVAAEAARESAPKPTPAPAKKAEAKSAKDEKGKDDKSRAKRDDKADAKPAQIEKPVPAPVETGADLARARALAVIDYLQKAGVPLGRATLAEGAAPLTERQGIGLALRS
ncbi:outer membrane protein OmpA-like peptidoglycan-associated protein [Methylorubrum rhodinum]|uniref:Outer membrane protein OmpA-like peptidoglycan-associated protein n=1 Tax=Methylorubrum rhodinum TaxID=29428 RepID=A0A840ZK40_9HYPH|nr:flagellar motor protein MotB [Methylorubrum rhodinum]MBB5757680.1 outer membrane protein OmpA-like peptidoglycan-associated protein [Methylorubrum rhodinum]